MEATIAQLTRQMEDARLTAEWCGKERAALLEKKQAAHREYYQLKLQLKALTEKNNGS